MGEGFSGVLGRISPREVWFCTLMSKVAYLKIPFHSTQAIKGRDGTCSEATSTQQLVKDETASASDLIAPKQHEVIAFNTHLYYSKGRF